MKIKFKTFPMSDGYGFPYSSRPDQEYLVLGIDNNQYYFLDESNEVGVLSKDMFEISDHSIPDFWVEENGQLAPEEWLWKKFFSLHGEPYLEWDEIWFSTQFMKGFEKFNLSFIPNRFKPAYDVNYKVNQINNYLKIASEYDTLCEDYISWEYEFGSFKSRGALPYYLSVNGAPQYYKKVLLSTEQEGFDILKGLLEQIRSPLERVKPDVDKEWLGVMRNRILFSIWSIWGVRSFDVFELKFENGSRNDYLLKYGDDVFILSLNFST
ncbi:hypothetical protein [Mucilaginibacter rubeus]|uniref:Uncharacterized protein n=1 Tax=Mucilaginibacter rubeus TaxID=2027860 RepID=A0A5C1HWU0_9SPHI|nr:hypothetical protein [Mucilaginibacter rubeus]QEM10085.1 hypothetical protein DEO27_008620 [Mucilaginibacter rubeus]